MHAYRFDQGTYYILKSTIKSIDKHFVDFNAEFNAEDEGTVAQHEVHWAAFFSNTMYYVFVTIRHLYI